MNVWHFCCEHFLEVVGGFAAVMGLTLRSLGIRKDLNRLENKLERVLDRLTENKKRK